LPLGSKAGDRFLLVANHEYVNPNLMFAGLGAGRDANLKATQEQIAVEMAAVGGAVVEIARQDDGSGGGAWKVVDASKYARRISANTAMEISGPAAGHDKLKTNADPAGRKVFGTFANCAGGGTPWGTWLTCEENFHTYFGGDATKLPDQNSPSATVSAARPSAGTSMSSVSTSTRNRTRPTRFGWVVEIDLYEPNAAGESARHSAASATKAAPTPWRRTVASCSTAATTLEWNMSTSSSPRGRGTPATGPPTRTCWTKARYRWRASTSTERWSGCRWCRDRGR
jgi:hypothetical protein